MVSDQELVKIEAKKARERNIKDFPDLGHCVRINHSNLIFLSYE